MKNTCLNRTLAKVEKAITIPALEVAPLSTLAQNLIQVAQDVPTNALLILTVGPRFGKSPLGAVFEHPQSPASHTQRAPLQALVPSNTHGFPNPSEV